MNETPPKTPPAAPPRAEKHRTETVRHGITTVDDYAWLKDANWQEVMRDPAVLSADIRAYLEAENAYTRAMMADTETFQEDLFQEMKARIPEDDDSPPDPDGPFEYFVRVVKGGEHPVFCRRVRGDATAQPTILLDGNTEAEGTSFYQVGGVDHSPDHAYLAHAADTNGSEIYTIRVRDVDSGTDLADAIPNASGNLVWAEDGRTLFYTVLDDSHRPCRVYRHRLGDDPADDTLVYEEADPGFFVGISKTESRRWLVIDAHDHQTSECYLIPAAEPETPPRLVAPRETEVEYDVGDWNGALAILTNADGAEDFKVVTAPEDAPGRDNWRDLVAHEPGRLILGIESFAGHLVRLERVNALPRIVIRDRAGDEHAISFEEEAYALGLDGGYEYDTTRLRFSYSSPTTPERVFDYDMASRERTLIKQQVVPSGHDPAKYETRRIHVPAADGEDIPVTLLYAKASPPDGSNPVLLYGYGSYGLSMPAGFSTPRLSLVDRGIVHATAHIRGGMEKGYRWYRMGKREQKMNTFTDFCAAADGLIARGLAPAEGVAAQGGSAGGMLMGAVVNMRPDLFAAIVAQVPFVDVLSTMSDTSLPLTPMEWPEWGNPIEDRSAFEDIRAYSPYDNVAVQAYPPILVTAGLTDPRVTYWEPAKWVAKLREMKTDGNPLLLKTNMEAGHGGASGRFERLRETALVFAFLLKVFGKA